MKFRSAVLVAAPALMMAGTAYAQTVIIQPEQEVYIREYVVEHPAPVVEVPSGYALEVGSTLPDIVEVTPVELDRIDRDYSYISMDGRTVVVEPETRRVVHIID